MGEREKANVAKYEQLNKVNTGVLCATFCSLCCSHSPDF